MFKMTINDWAWAVVAVVLTSQIVIEKWRGWERDAAIKCLKGEVKFLGERLSDRPSTFEVLLYIEDADKRKAASMTSEQIAKEIADEFDAATGKWMTGATKAKLRAIIISRIGLLLEPRKPPRDECKGHPVPGKGCVRPSPHEAARGAKGCIWCGKQFKESEATNEG